MSVPQSAESPSNPEVLQVPVVPVEVTPSELKTTTAGDANAPMASSCCASEAPVVPQAAVPVENSVVVESTPVVEAVVVPETTVSAPVVDDAPASGNVAKSCPHKDAFAMSNLDAASVPAGTCPHKAAAAAAVATEGGAAACPHKAAVAAAPADGTCPHKAAAASASTENAASACPHKAAVSAAAAGEAAPVAVTGTCPHKAAAAAMPAEAAAAACPHLAAAAAAATEAAAAAPVVDAPAAPVAEASVTGGCPHKAAAMAAAAAAPAPAVEGGLSDAEILAAATGTSLAPPAVCPVSKQGGSGIPTTSGGCPVDHSGTINRQRLLRFNPLEDLQRAQAAGVAAAVVDADGTPLNPLNNMPTLSNEQLAEQQGVNLGTKRTISGIPKTGDKENWVYPSPQQYYNALLRKNKDPDATAIDAMLYIHNVVNEDSWNTVLEWEAKYHTTCPGDITLQRFTGRYGDNSLRGLFSTYLRRRGEPFDRHDWYIDRCGKQVRYIIDYYDDPDKNDAMQVTIVTRPAPFDSIDNLRDYITKPVYDFFGLRWSTEPRTEDEAPAPTSSPTLYAQHMASNFRRMFNTATDISSTAWLRAQQGWQRSQELYKSAVETKDIAVQSANDAAAKARELGDRAKQMADRARELKEKFFPSAPTTGAGEQ